MDRWSWAAVAAAVPAVAIVALALGLLAGAPSQPSDDTMTLESWAAPTSGLVADLAPTDDPLAALEAFQSPTAGLLNLDDRRTP